MDHTKIYVLEKLFEMRILDEISWWLIDELCFTFPFSNKYLQ